MLDTATKYSEEDAMQFPMAKYEVGVALDAELKACLGEKCEDIITLAGQELALRWVRGASGGVEPFQPQAVGHRLCQPGMLRLSGCPMQGLQGLQMQGKPLVSQVQVVMQGCSELGFGAVQVPVDQALLPVVDVHGALGSVAGASKLIQ